ncbi:MAG TPA: hypothetical protein VFE13_13810, partial [Caulobacteraceae bacterium]|nr:hypothetical protein [Caulobacteraceae bacterium]
IAGPPGSAHGADGASLPDQVVSSALRYQIAKPLVDAIMKDAGLNGGGIAGIAESLAQLGKPNGAAALPDQPGLPEDHVDGSSKAG